MTLTLSILESQILTVLKNSLDPTRFFHLSRTRNSIRHLYIASHNCIAEALYNSRGRVVILMERLSDGHCWVFPSLRIAAVNIPQIWPPRISSAPTPTRAPP